MCPKEDAGWECLTMNFLSFWVSSIFYVMHTPWSVLGCWPNYHISTKYAKSHSQTTPVQITHVLYTTYCNCCVLGTFLWYCFWCYVICSMYNSIIVYVTVTQYVKTQHNDTFLEIQIFASVSYIYLKLCSVVVSMLYCK